MIKIILACNAGMSTSLLVSKMNLAAIKMNVEVKIQAVAENDFDRYASDTNILLLGPQVGYTLKKMKEQYSDSGIKIAVINSIDYGTMNGEHVLNMALQL